MMPDQTLVEELAALRAQISQLQAREAALSLEVEVTRPMPRPGWPIRRLGQGSLH